MSSFFDLDRVTKRFYDKFQQEHNAFVGFVQGIPDEAMQRWYVFVMLNRLMFIYFIQKKGFLDSNSDYLRVKLYQSKRKGKDRFYLDFLCPLFFEGFAKKVSDRSPGVNELLGQIPYLNGSIFLKHQIEECCGQKIQIADMAFDQVFEFFEQYQWHLDERPVRNDNEINPDVLGYIFEKYINQKQMGAYYTKEDITEYISKNTIIPRLFDMAKQKCPIALEPHSAIWQLLQDQPDRYIYDAVKKGMNLTLPKEIADGILDVSKRTKWNEPSPEAYALPTEIWREVVARRSRYAEVKTKLERGEINDINDLITLNLNIRQFAQDVIANCERPEVLCAFWHSLVGQISSKSKAKIKPGMSILDPTCGSGAFLFAALQILEPLYEACLERMQVFVHEAAGMAQPQIDMDFEDFQHILQQMQKHPNQRYFIFKSIIITNLYGVDIMAEAVDICKLRLFLKLVAQIERVDQIEPLPDIDFNIQAGNTLVGYSSEKDLETAIKSKFDFEDALIRIKQKAEAIAQLFAQFRQQQTELHGEANLLQKQEMKTKLSRLEQELHGKADLLQKQEMKTKLSELEQELHGYLAHEYGIEPSQKAQFQKWLDSHQPFHWLIHFYEILQRGGFDVIIGNPPYVEYSKVKKTYTIHGYSTEECGNLYAFVVERNVALLTQGSRTGMIIPSAGICTDRMMPLQKILQRMQVWISTYAIRPAQLFPGVEQRLAIYLGIQQPRQSQIYSTGYILWHEVYRPYLLPLLQYITIQEIEFRHSLPKLHTALEKAIWQKLQGHGILQNWMSNSANVVYYHNAPRYWIRAMNFTPYFWNEKQGSQISSHLKTIAFFNAQHADIAIAVLNSSLFYWWFIVLSNGRDLSMREIAFFPMGIAQMADCVQKRLYELQSRLMADFKQHAERKTCFYKTTGKVIYDEFYPCLSKPILDEIDRVLAQHYGLNDEELDFIIHYGIKYRMGKEIGKEKTH